MPASPQRYRPPAWRTAGSAAAYVGERLRAADSSLDAAVRAIKDASGDPYFAELFDDQLVSVVEMARQIHIVLDREERRLAEAQRAAKAREALADWVSRFSAELPASTERQDDETPDNPYRISEDDVMALWRIQKSIDYRIRVTSQGVPRRLGATRETGGVTECKKDRRAAQFAIGELAYWVRTWDENKPQTKTSPRTSSITAMLTRRS